MIKKIKTKLDQKDIAILGFGREGKATYEFIKKYVDYKSITVIDKFDVYGSNKDLFSSDIKFVYGDNYLDNLDKYDLVIKTPGISLKDIDTSNINITSELELVLEAHKDKIIGVTGTKGKSTTSSLIHSILINNGIDAILAGNIGIPVFSILDNVKPDTWLVLEMSSHQLEYMHVSPHIGIVLNLFEDHLDHAGSVKHYHESKMNMFKNQTNNDVMVYCSDNEALNNLVNKNDYLGKKVSVSFNDKATIYLDDDTIYYKDLPVFNKYIKRNLLGVHNLENICVAFAVAMELGLDFIKTMNAIETFKPLEYRLECIGRVGDVKYYVDTLATIPSATLEAIEAIDDIDTLIFGGMDRGISYDGFADALNKSKIEHFICMPTTGHNIGKLLPPEKTYFVDTLEEACILAKKVTTPGKSCILSPAAASYEQFKNYAEKGDKFKEYVIKR